MLKDLSVILKHTEVAGECLVWTKCLNTDGYPRAVIEGNNNAKVHRVVFELSNGYLPEVVRHTCDNTKCVNPDHLLGGTALDNVRDRVERGRTYGSVLAKEVRLVKALRGRGYTHTKIAYVLNIKTKRVEYILNKH